MFLLKRENRYVLDSSSILDGRIFHLFGRKFFEGKVIVPQFVRTVVEKVIGPDTTNLIQSLGKGSSVEFFADKCSGSIEEICVLKVAEKRKATVFTASDELCRHAKDHPSVRVIDVRDLYRALTPIFTPDRMISVRILKKGLRANEGIGYIEGVKVVVENAAKHVNHVVNARVQTMISSDKGSLVFCGLEDASVHGPARGSGDQHRRGNR